MPNVKFAATLIQRLKRYLVRRLRGYREQADLAKRVGLSRGDLNAVAAAGIFDERFYLMTYPDIAAAGVNPFEHFLTYGRFEGRKPSLFFDPHVYAAANPEVAASGIEPFLHYALIGQAGGAPLRIDFAKRVGLSRSDLNAVVAAGIFDERFYLKTYPDVAAAGLNPFEHFLTYGRFEGRKPSLFFDPHVYAAANPEVAASGMEPFLHYALIGQAGGAPLHVDFAKRVGLSRSELKAVAAAGIFDERFYLKTYPDVAAAGENPFEYFLASGRFERHKPSGFFDPDAYAAANPDVAISGMDPFLHYALIGQPSGAPLSKAETIEPRPALTREIASGTKRLIVFLTPGFEARAGGVIQIAHKYRESQALNDLHGAKVALCSMPGDDPLFLKYSWFDNNNYLLDLNTVLRSCTELESLLLHIPEYAVDRVAAWLDDVSSSLLRDVRDVHLNIMIQNIDLVEGQNVAALKRFGRVTATTGHAAYGNSTTRRRLGVTLHKLGVYFGPEHCKYTSYQNKKPTLVVSHDAHPLKERVLRQIALAHPNLEICVVENIRYEEFETLITDAKWSLTFGEGLDAYYAHAIFSGGNGFAVFNDRFFTPDFATLETVYPSWETLIDKITFDLTRLDEPAAYDRCNRQAFDILASLHGTERFRTALRAFYRGEYTFP